MNDKQAGNENKTDSEQELMRHNGKTMLETRDRTGEENRNGGRGDRQDQRDYVPRLDLDHDGGSSSSSS